MNGEVAGNIRIELFRAQGDVNRWLDSHPDTEVADIKFACGTYEGHLVPLIMIIYRPEEGQV